MPTAATTRRAAAQTPARSHRCGRSAVETLARIRVVSEWIAAAEHAALIIGVSVNDTSRLIRIALAAVNPNW